MIAIILTLSLLALTLFGLPLFATTTIMVEEAPSMEYVYAYSILDPMESYHIQARRSVPSMLNLEELRQIEEDRAEIALWNQKYSRKRQPFAPLPSDHGKP
jgi:hypothetical protein